MRPALRRAALYGGLAAVVLAGWAAHRRLSGDARAAADPYLGPEAVSGTLGSERLYDLLVRTGSGAGEAAEASRALARVQSPRTLRPSDHYRVVRSTSGALLGLTLVHGLTVAAVVPKDGGFVARARTLPVETETRAARGTISGSLWASLQSRGAPAEVVVAFADVFRWSVDFLTEPRDGDSFSVVWTERRTPDGRVLGREIEAAVYDGRVAGRKVGLLFDGDYYDESGQSLRRRFLRAPLQYSRISSYFTNRRYHPILRIYRPHHGIDYAAPRGTPVVVVADGVVVFAGRRGGYGNAVEVRHGPVYTTLYGHFSRIARGIRRGVRVHQGQLVGYVGSTGISTGPHLHFQITKNGRFQNFLTMRLPFAHAVPRGKLASFRARAKALLAAVGGVHGA
jgi:murein DD-endopeptidase MepM/ murein hydrolase activator NlpD